MEYIYAAMLLHKAGKEISDANMTAVLKSAGVDADSARIKATVAALKSVKIDDVIKNAVVATSSAAAPSEAKSEKKAEEPKEDKGKTEEEAAAGLGALFG